MGKEEARRKGGKEEIRGKGRVGKGHTGSVPSFRTWLSPCDVTVIISPSVPLLVALSLLGSNHRHVPMCHMAE